MKDTETTTRDQGKETKMTTKTIATRCALTFVTREQGNGGRGRKMTPDLKSALLHVFERAGLGLAPFRWVGIEEKRGPIRTELAPGIWGDVGAPGQPMGTCDYCGTGIAICFKVRSADDREFIVGSECIRKTGDMGLNRAVDKAKLMIKHAADDKRIALAYEKLDTLDWLAPALRALPGKGLSHSFLDYALFCRKHGGRTSKLAVARVIERAIKARGTTE